MPPNNIFHFLVITHRSNLKSLPHRTNKRNSRPLVMLLRRNIVRSKTKMGTIRPHNERRLRRILMTYIVFTRRRRINMIIILPVRLVIRETKDRVRLATGGQIRTLHLANLVGVRHTMRDTIINSDRNQLSRLLNTTRRHQSTTNTIRRTMFHVRIRIRGPLRKQRLLHLFF